MGLFLSCLSNTYLDDSDGDLNELTEEILQQQYKCMEEETYITPPMIRE